MLNSASGKGKKEWRNKNTDYYITYLNNIKETSEKLSFFKTLSIKNKYFNVSTTYRIVRFVTKEFTKII